MTVLMIIIMTNEKYSYLILNVRFFCIKIEYIFRNVKEYIQTGECVKKYMCE